MTFITVIDVFVYDIREYASEISLHSSLFQIKQVYYSSYLYIYSLIDFKLIGYMPIVVLLNCARDSLCQISQSVNYCR